MPQNATWYNKSTTTGEGADSVSPERVLTLEENSNVQMRPVLFFYRAFGLVLGEFRGVGNLAEQEGVLHLGLRGKDNKKHSRKRVLFFEL